MLRRKSCWKYRWDIANFLSKHFSQILWALASVRTLSILLNNPLHKNMINQGNRQNVHLSYCLVLQLFLQLIGWPSLLGLRYKCWKVWVIMFFLKLLVFILKSTEFYYISFLYNIFFYEWDQLRAKKLYDTSCSLLMQFFYWSSVVSITTGVVPKLLCNDTFCT